MADYRCLVCEEIFENKIIAVIHHMTTKHEDYEVVGTDLKMKVKS